MTRRYGLIAIQLLVVACVSGAPHRAWAVTPMVLIDRQLQAHYVNLQGLDDGVVSFFDADRRLRVEPLDQFIQIRRPVGTTSANDTLTQDDPQPQQNARQATRIVELTDGQRLAGRWVGCDEPTQTIRWHHPVLGELSLTLDQVRVLWSTSSSLSNVQSPESDWVELANGDRLTGFVTRVSASGVAFEQQGLGQLLMLSSDQIRAMRLANPRRRPAGDANMLWLEDGSKVLTSTVSVASGRASFHPALPGDESTIEVPLTQINRIDLSIGRAYLKDLSELPIEVVGGGEVFGVDLGPRVAGTAVYLHAPVSIRYVLSEGSTRLAGTAAFVSESAPSRSQGWADFEIIFTVDGRVVFRKRLNHRDPVAQFNVPVDGTNLTIEVDSAVNGPIMDRVVLQDVVILIEPHAD